VTPGPAPDASVRSGIENTLALYAWAYDMDELERMDDCFTDDAEVWFGPERCVARSELIAEFDRLRAARRARGMLPLHVMSNLYISECTADHAVARSCFTVLERPTLGGAVAVSSMGYYDDRFRLENGVWRVSHRRVWGGIWATGGGATS
jgi:hypothetical protein